jgi:hypothetical protein
MMNEEDFFKKYEHEPIVLSKVEEGKTYGMIDKTPPKDYMEVIATNSGIDLNDDNKSLMVQDIRDGNNIFELFPGQKPTESGNNQTLHQPKTASQATKAGSRKRIKGSRRVMKARKSNSKTRSKRGGAKSKKSKKEAELCPICLEELKKGEQIPKLNCKHKFHKSCLEPVCRQKGNVGVPCPICRGDISFACAADITRASPWKYDPYDESIPFDIFELNNMTLKERRQVEKEVQKHRNNWLARRRKTIRKETPEQRDLRVERESKLHADLETARNRPFINGSHSPVYNPNSPRVENGRFSPHSPDYPPPSPRSPGSP